jgi:hypothetical protein
VANSFRLAGKVFGPGRKKEKSLTATGNQAKIHDKVKWAFPSGLRRWQGFLTLSLQAGCKGGADNNYLWDNAAACGKILRRL